MSPDHLRRRVPDVLRQALEITAAHQVQDILGSLRFPFGCRCLLRRLRSRLRLRFFRLLRQGLPVFLHVC